MKTRKTDTDPDARSVAGRGRRKNQSFRGGKAKNIASEASRHSNSEISDVPPNENIRKRADEIYGDTEIPERKGGS